MLFCQIDATTAGGEISKLYKDIKTLLGSENHDTAKQLYSYAISKEFTENYVSEEMYDANGEILIDQLMRILNRLGEADQYFNNKEIQITKNLERSISVRNNDTPLDFDSYENAMAIALNYNNEGLMSKQYVAVVKSVKKSGKVVHNVEILKKNSKTIKLSKKQNIQLKAIEKLTKMMLNANIEIKVIDEAFKIENEESEFYSTKAGEMAIIGILGIQSRGSGEEQSRLEFLKDFGSFAFKVMEGQPLYTRAVALAESESVQREIWGDEYSKFLEITPEEHRANKTASKIIGEILADDFAYKRNSNFVFWQRVKTKIIEFFKKVSKTELSELRKEINRQYTESLNTFLDTYNPQENKSNGEPLFSTDNISDRNKLLRRIINISNKQIYLLQKLKVNISPDLYSVKAEALAIGDLTYLTMGKVESLVNILSLLQKDMKDTEQYLNDVGKKINQEYLEMVYKTQGDESYYRELNKKLVALRQLYTLYNGIEQIVGEYKNITTVGNNNKTVLYTDLYNSIKKEIDAELKLSKYTSNNNFLSEESIKRLEKILSNYTINDSGEVFSIGIENLIKIYDYKNANDFSSKFSTKLTEYIYSNVGWASLSSNLNEKIDGEKSLLGTLEDIIKSSKSLVETQSEEMLTAFAYHYMGDNGVNVTKYSNLHNTRIGSNLTSIFSKLTSGSMALETLTQLMANVSKIHSDISNRKTNDFKRELNSKINILENNQRDLKWAFERNTDVNSANFDLPTGRFLSPSDYVAYKKARNLAKVQIAKKYGVPVKKLVNHTIGFQEFGRWEEENTEVFFELSTDPIFTLRENLLRNLKLTEGNIVFSLPSYDKAEEELKIWHNYFEGVGVTPELKSIVEAIKDRYKFDYEGLKSYMLNANGYVKEKYDIDSLTWISEHDKIKNFQSKLAKYTAMIEDPSIKRTEDEDKFIRENTKTRLRIPSRKLYPSEQYNNLTSKQKEVLEYLRAKKTEYDKLLPAKTFRANEIMIPQVRATTLELLGNGKFATAATDAYDKTFNIVQDDELLGLRSGKFTKDIKDNDVVITDIPISYVKRINPRELTQDLAMGMISYSIMANKYFEMESVVHAAEIGKIFLEANPLKTGDTTTKQNFSDSTNDKYIKEQYKKLIDRNFYGSSQERSSKTKFNLFKASRLVQKASRFMLMGCDVTMAMVNAISGWNQIHQEAIGNQMFDYKSRYKALQQLIPSMYGAVAGAGEIVRNDEFALYKDFFDFNNEFGAQNVTKDFNINRATRALNPVKIAMIAHTTVNNFIDSWVYLSRLHYVKVLIDGKQSSLYDAFQVVTLEDNKTKKLQLKENVTDLDGNIVDNKFLSDFKTTTNVLLNEIAGNNDSLSKNSLSMNLWGSWAQFMKSWALPAYERHFGPARYNVAKKVVTTGMQWDVIRSVGNFIMMGWDAARHNPSKSFWERMAPTLDSENSEIIQIDEARKKYIKGNYRKAAMSYLQVLAFKSLRIFLTSVLKNRDDDDEILKENEGDLDWTAVLLYFVSKGERELGAMNPLAVNMMFQETQSIFNPSSAAGVFLESSIDLAKNLATQERFDRGHLILDESGDKMVAPYNPETGDFDMSMATYIPVNNRTPEGYRVVREKKYKESLDMFIPGRKTRRMFWDNDAETMLYSYIQGKYKLK